MSDGPIHISIPRGWFAVFGALGALVGLGASFVVGPAVTALLQLVGDAPGPLRLAAGLPIGWAIPLLTLAGLAGGLWIAREWHTENGTITISSEGMTVTRAGSSSYVARERIGEVFTDSGELVVTDETTTEILRITSERALVGRLRDAFTSQGYPWLGTEDPHATAFTPWVDHGGDDLDEQAHDLLRARRRSLHDTQHGAAEDALEELRRCGVSVRDRHGAQQYRITPAPQD